MSEINKYRGDTKPIVFKLWEDKDAGTPLDITNFTFKFTVNSLQDPTASDTPVFSLVGAIITPASDGRVRFLPSANNMDIDPAIYFFDFEVTDADGFISTEMKDRFILTQDISK